MSAVTSCLTRVALAGVALQIFAANVAAAAAPVTVCLTPPKAQLGQGNDTMTDVSEPVRLALGKFMAGPAIQLVSLDSHIPVQIEAEATQKACAYVLQTAVEQTRGSGAGGLLKALAPLASAALPAIVGAGGDMAGAIAAQAASTAISTAAMEAAAQDYMAAMQGAQQNSVKRGDTVTVTYQLTRVGVPKPVKQAAVKQRAKANGVDLLSPLLEKVAIEVVTAATSGA